MSERGGGRVIVTRIKIHKVGGGGGGGWGGERLISFVRSSEVWLCGVVMALGLDLNS